MKPEEQELHDEIQQRIMQHEMDSDKSVNIIVVDYNTLWELRNIKGYFTPAHEDSTLEERYLGISIAAKKTNKQKDIRVY